MPQLVSLFNAVGGGAAALVAINDYVHTGARVGEVTTVTTLLDVLIGAVTFSGSIIAAGKLQGLINGAPVTFPGSRAVNLALAAAGIGAARYLIATPSTAVLIVVIVAALGFGETMVMPIGGADMPVVISLLNAFTGTAVAMAGFVIGNWALIIAGALVDGARLRGPRQRAGHRPQDQHVLRRREDRTGRTHRRGQGLRGLNAYPG